MTIITIKSVFENTVAEVADVIGREYWHSVVVAVADQDGTDGLISLENNVTVLHETGNLEGLMEFIEDLADEHAVEF